MHLGFTAHSEAEVLWFYHTNESQRKMVIITATKVTVCTFSDPGSTMSCVYFKILQGQIPSSALVICPSVKDALAQLLSTS